MPERLGRIADPAVVLLERPTRCTRARTAPAPAAACRRVENTTAPPSRRTCASTSSRPIPRPPARPVTMLSSSVRSSTALPRHGSARDQRQRRPRQRLRRHVLRRADLAHEIVGQRRDVLAPAAQRRHVDRGSPTAGGTDPRGRGLPAARCRSRDRRRPSAGRRAPIVAPVSASMRFAIAQDAREPRLHPRRRLGDVLQVERAAERVVQAARCGSRARGRAPSSAPRDRPARRRARRRARRCRTRRSRRRRTRRRGRWPAPRESRAPPPDAPCRPRLAPARPLSSTPHAR